jgi:hypothetical protein
MTAAVLKLCSVRQVVAYLSTYAKNMISSGSLDRIKLDFAHCKPISTNKNQNLTLLIWSFFTGTSLNIGCSMRALNRL